MRGGEGKAEKMTYHSPLVFPRLSVLEPFRPSRFGFWPAAAEAKLRFDGMVLGFLFLVVVVKGIELRQLSTSRPSRRVSGRVVGREEGGVRVATSGWTSTAVETDA